MFKEDDVRFIESQLKDEPQINVIDKATLEERIDKVFNIIYDVLVQTFGPGGSGLFVSMYPALHNTKDGFTGMKYVNFDIKIDQVIFSMIHDICNRANWTSGDGTTTATLITKKSYDAYRADRDFLNNKRILPRKIIKRLHEIKDEVIKQLKEEARQIRSDDPEELYKNIKEIAYISSNGDDVITEMIAGLYKELMYPAIITMTARDGKMRSELIKGYRSELILTDERYQNNDDKTMYVKDCDVLVFDHKVRKETYKEILEPLNEWSRQRGRHLICIAPWYDETALNSTIGLDLGNEYKKNHDINLVLLACPNPTGDKKIRMNDLAMLLGTMMITEELERELIERSKNEPVTDVYNMDDRGIAGTKVLYDTGKVSPNNERIMALGNAEEVEPALKSGDKALRIGYVGECNLGMESSMFTDLRYVQEEYDRYFAEAKRDYEETRRKCEEIGLTVSPQLAEKKQRLLSLGLKMGIIYAGASTQIAQSYDHDFIDDAVKAAASAYNYGVVYGCGVTLMRILRSMKISDELGRHLRDMLYKAYWEIYQAVICNVIDDVEVTDTIENEVAKYADTLIYYYDNEDGFAITSDKFTGLSSVLLGKGFPSDRNVSDVIVAYSILTNQVFDLVNGCYSTKVINSVQTDSEILSSVVDLLALLITGNSIVLV